MSIIVAVVFSAILVGADQFIKYLVVQYLKPIEYIDVIKGVLRFRYIENTGAIFGSFAAHTIILTVFSAVLLCAAVFFFVKNRDKSKFINFCLVLMISGGIGNIIDRVRLHYVVDFIEPLFVNFAIFNFADCLITVGAFAIFFYLIRDIIKDTKKKNIKDGETDDGAE